MLSCFLGAGWGRWCPMSMWISPSCSAKPHYVSFPTVPFPPASWNSSPLPSTFSRNSIRLCRANKVPDKHHHQQSFSQENIAVSHSKNNASTPSNSLLSFLCPLLRFFSAVDPSQERSQFLEVATSSFSTLARLPWGSKSLLNSQETSMVDPPVRLQLFEFEACPFCRRVREAMTELDLSVEIYPCPKGSVRHRELVKRIGGKEQFPFLVDPNTGISMYESSEIVKYLFQQYGKGLNPSFGLLESTLFTGWVPTVLRAGRGMTFWEKARINPPPKKLELFSYENNPYARIVREALCELELPYILQNVGEGSARRNLLLKESGSNKVPYIIDPNTDIRISDYMKILTYLFATYSMATL